mmetsp:Transcript_11656/g.17489  ORF Transcript_11656/g.17489 Transcript_11656/m.17489 type:complete len:254 (+) Transcript_11656:1239-2000(+)
MPSVGKKWLIWTRVVRFPVNLVVCTTSQNGVGVKHNKLKTNWVFLHVVEQYHRRWTFERFVNISSGWNKYYMRTHVSNASGGIIKTHECCSFHVSWQWKTTSVPIREFRNQITTRRTAACICWVAKPHLCNKVRHCSDAWELRSPHKLWDTVKWAFWDKWGTMWKERPTCRLCGVNLDANQRASVVITQAQIIRCRISLASLWIDRSESLTTYTDLTRVWYCPSIGASFIYSQSCVTLQQYSIIDKIKHFHAI